MLQLCRPFAEARLLREFFYLYGCILIDAEASSFVWADCPALACLDIGDQPACFKLSLKCCAPYRAFCVRIPLLMANRLHFIPVVSVCNQEYTATRRGKANADSITK